jgi:tetratricopeptide (TPR) repeat protein
MIWILVYTSLGLAGKPPVGYEFKVFGVGLQESTVPAGAVRYMDKNGVYGRTFNPFHWGGYIIWTGYPGRTVFIDPRGGLTEDLLEKYSLTAASGSLWMLEQLFMNYRFDAVILDYPSREDGTRNMNGLVLSDPNWALVYWDDTSLLYLRRGGRYQHLVEKDEYRYVKPSTGRLGLNAALTVPAMPAGIEYDLKRSIRENPSSTGYGLLGHLYSKTGRYQEALVAFSKVLEYPRQTDKLSAYTGLGTVYYQMGDMTRSLSCYEKAVRIQKDGSFLYNLATIYVATGDDAKAVKTLLEAIKLNPELEQAHTLLAAANKRLGKTP